MPHAGGLTETQKAYIAGIIDGEGCIFLGVVKNTSKPYSEKFYSSTLSVEMACQSVPQYLQDIYGGGLYSRIRPHRSPIMWIWKANGVLAEEVLKDVYPYLVEKQEEANIFFEFRKTLVRGMKARRDKLSKKELNKRDEIIERLRSSRKKYVKTI